MNIDKGLEQMYYANLYNMQLRIEAIRSLYSHIEKDLDVDETALKLRDIVEYGQALLLTSSGGEDRIEMYKHFMDMFEANGVVDIAFKTDERLACK